MSQRFQGLNTNALSLSGADKTALLPTLKAMNSISHTMMDDWSYTVQCATAMPDTEWHHRSWNPFGARDDTHTYLEVTPEAWAQRVHGFDKHPNIWHHMLNEPTNDDVPRLVDWLIEAMALTGRNSKYPTKCIVGNLAVDKSFQHIGDSIKWRDDWLRLFRAFEEHSGWHRFGVHRYWIGDVRLAYVDGYPANIRLDYPTHKDYLDSSKHRLKLERLSNGHLPPHWHGYADMWMWQLCIEHGIAIPDIVETEGIHDEKRDPGTQPYIEYVDNNFPTGYNNGRARGTWTYEKWSEASSGLSYSEQLNAQIIARTRVHLQLEKDYPQFKGKQKGAHWFSYTKAFDWTKAGFSLYYDPLATDLIQSMIDAPLFVQEVDDMPSPIVFDPPLFEADVSYPGILNMRADMTVKSKDLGNITDTSVRMFVSKKTNEANGYQWYKFKLNTGIVELVGYFADIDGVKINYIPEPEPPPPPGDPTPTEGTDDLRIDALEARILTLETKLETMQAVFRYAAEHSNEFKELLYAAAGITTSVVMAEHLYNSVVSADTSGLLEKLNAKKKAG